EIYGNSGAPYTTLGERALYSWSRWHGGEDLLVKVLEAVNVLPLFAAGIGTWIATLPFEHVVTVYLMSWLRAAVFLSLSTLQWFWIGRAIDSGITRRQPSVVA